MKPIAESKSGLKLKRIRALKLLRALGWTGKEEGTGASWRARCGNNNRSFAFCAIDSASD